MSKFQFVLKRAFTADECIAWAHIILPNGIFGGEIIDDWYQLSGQQVIFQVYLFLENLFLQADAPSNVENFFCRWNAYSQFLCLR